ncbi:class I SAM-dependent RNA methyltransferase [Brevundimonas sp. 2R-24]|uniref:Class I SAM-dependent RNA methyltransferase n=1 Tax=Peiella sedimenti TaxID=3061083 RepID=A0ABT8SM88_9CAUL|nr:class I SAM-dependent RNA methyltransferase [Caulobacteraceae bacterium XZ-24]
MTAPDLEDLEITDLGAQGDGLAIMQGGVRIHVPLTLPGERVLAQVEGDRGQLVEVLRPSPDRQTPASPHYGECGGCSLQHWASGPYLQWKTDRVRHLLAREGIETEVRPAIPCRPGSRRRLGLHARRGQNGRVLLGFKARRSWRLVEVERCPVALRQIEAAFPALREVAAPFLEHPKSAPTLHVTWTETGLDVEVTGVERKSGGLSRDGRVRAAAAAAAADLARLTLGGEALYQAREPVVRFGQALVAPPPGAFLQAVEAAETAMAELAVQALKGCGRTADLFCGMGAFAFRLAETGQVLAADSWAPGIAALERGAAHASGLKPIRAMTRDLFREPLSAFELKGVDGALFDPPRAGGLAQAMELGKSDIPTVVGISCNPSTFARDARALIEAGFRLDEVTPVDQFLWSAHVEVVGVFRR